VLGSPDELSVDSEWPAQRDTAGCAAGRLGQPFGSANIVYVPTASVAEPGDHGWFVEGMNRLYGLGWREFDVLELNGLPRQMVLDRLLHADAIYVEGIESRMK
jgi:hypothetical protein